MEEQWKPIPNFPDYDASNLGRIRSRRRRGRVLVLSPGVNSEGYEHLVLYPDTGPRSNQRVHRLVALTFLGDQPGMQVRHLDGNPRNNALSNLAYGTQSENELDKVRHGTVPQATKTHCPQGHPYDAANTYRYNGRRHCQTCQKARSALRSPTRNYPAERAARAARQAVSA